MVVVIGGMGSVWGALLASLLIGVLNAYGVLLLPKAAIVLIFVVMAVVLMVRPWGLLGRPEIQLRAAGQRRGGRGAAPAARPDPARRRGCSRPGRPAPGPADLLDLDRGRDLRLRALRGEPAPPDGGGRHGVVRPRGLLRPRRLRRRAAPQAGGPAHARRLRARAGGGRAGRLRVRLLLRAAHQHLLRDADARLRPDRLRDRAPVGRRHRRRQRHAERLARLPGSAPRAATTTGRSPPPLGGPASCCGWSPPRPSASRCARSATTRGARRRWA